MKSPPKLFLGAAASPFASEPRFQALREEKKINAGAQFFQTNLIYDPDGLDLWLEELDKRNILDKIYILAGVTPFKSVGMARYMKNRVPGMDVPDEIVKRMADTPKEKQPQEGIDICVESIQRLKSVEGLAGFHVMAIEWEEKVPEIVERAGLFPRPQAA